jgi:hypothetical protein
VPIRLLDVDLDEGAGQLLLFPRRRRLAGAKTHDHVLPPCRLAWVKRDILDDSVALVKNSEHRDALRHRRDPAFAVGGRADLPSGRERRILPLGTAAARGQRQRNQQRCGSALHAYSGIQGS